MTRNDEFIGQLESYLDEYEGSTPLPEGVRDAIRAELPSTRQRPPWWPARRFPEMNNMAKLGIAAAAVVVAALLGYNYFAAPNVAGPGPDEPTPSPTEAATLLEAGVLAPGRHYYEAGPITPVRIDFTVQDGWTARTDGQVSKNADGAGEVGLYPAIVTHVYTDACASEGTLTEIGPTADDLVTALTSQQNSEVIGPTDVTIGGYAGQRLDIAIPADVDVATCRQSELIQIWADEAETTFLALPVGGSASVYVFDVDGERVVVTTGNSSESSAADEAERDAIIASMTFGP